MLKISRCVAKLQSVGIFYLDCCVQGLCGSIKVVKTMWNSSQSTMDKKLCHKQQQRMILIMDMYRTQRFLLLMKSMMIKIGKVVIMKE